MFPNNSYCLFYPAVGFWIGAAQRFTRALITGSALIRIFFFFTLKVAKFPGGQIIPRKIPPSLSPTGNTKRRDVQQILFTSVVSAARLIRGERVSLSGTSRK